MHESMVKTDSGQYKSNKISVTHKYTIRKAVKEKYGTSFKDGT